MTDTKKARDLADSLEREGLEYEDEEAMLRQLADEVDRLRELRVHRCGSHGDVGNAWGCPECVRELRKERKTKWEPLLAAAVFGHDADCHSREPRESGDCELCKRIAACEEKP